MILQDKFKSKMEKDVIFNNIMKFQFVTSPKSSKSLSLQVKYKNLKTKIFKGFSPLQNSFFSFSPAPRHLADKWTLILTNLNFQIGLTYNKDPQKKKASSSQR